MNIKKSPVQYLQRRQERSLPQWLSLFISLVLALMVAGCLTPGEDDPLEPPVDKPPVEKPPVDPEQGEWEFVTADGVAGQQSPEYGDDSTMAPSEDADLNSGQDGGDRTVQEGDIYRVLGDGLILNLNSYRGLQVIDFSDVSNPKVVGRAEMSGYPVEMYVLEDQAYVLMNDWRGYYGSRFDTKFEEVSGGIIIQVDLGDPAHPVVIDQAYVTGSILRSRVVAGSRAAALYVAASDYGQFEDPVTGDLSWGSRSYVKSFDIFNASLTPKTEMEIGGYVTDIQATPEALLVARWNDSWRMGRYEMSGSLISIIDISNPDGTMEAGDEISVKGVVDSQFNMDLYNGVLRVASGVSWWGENETSWVQTYDATDFANLVLIDEVPFGNAQEQLYATLFLGNKAFFVTYFRQDPFHAFEITDEGILTEKSEYIVSGWNDFFRAVMGETRLIGIGMDDGGRDGANRAAVSLYDITDLENPEPLMARERVDAQYTWSEANWDHRAFSVLEGAVSVESVDGDLETGLVLLPYSGYDSNWSRYHSSVQVFTFSSESLTKRGVMDHPSTVRRTFLADQGLATNLSETDMGFYDVTDPDSPEQLGTVELAPNYGAIIPLGDYAARLKHPDDGYSWYGSDRDGAEEIFSVVEIVPFDENPDLAAPVATVEVPGGASLVKSGDLLVATSTVSVSGGASDRVQHQVRLMVIDVTDPVQPGVVFDGVYGDLPVGYQGGPEFGYDMGFGYWGWGSSSLVPEVVGDKLVFTELVGQQKREGTRTYCSEYPVSDYYSCGSDTDGTSGDSSQSSSGSAPSEDPGSAKSKDPVCTYHVGGKYCMNMNDEPETCWGSFYQCSRYASGKVECEELEDDVDVETYKHCSTDPHYRYWNQYVFHGVDLADPASPKVLDPVEMGTDDEGVGILVRGGKLYHSYKRPVKVTGDARPFVRYYFRDIDLAGGESGPEINVPGRLIELDGDTVFTEDFVYGEDVVESAVNKLVIQEGKAYLKGRKRFEDQVVEAVLVDGAGYVYVSHMQSYYSYYSPMDSIGYGYHTDDAVSPMGARLKDRTSESEEDRYTSTLSVFGVDDEGFTRLSSEPVDRFATLIHAMPGRGIFQVTSGLVIMNTEDPAKPFPQAYYPTKGWPQGFVTQGNYVMFAAGRYGIYRFDGDVYNLLAR